MTGVLPFFRLRSRKKKRLKINDSAKKMNKLISDRQGRGKKVIVLAFLSQICQAPDICYPLFPLHFEIKCPFY